MLIFAFQKSSHIYCPEINFWYEESLVSITMSKKHQQAFNEQI